LVSLFPSGSQTRLIDEILIGKIKFSINLLSVAPLSTNQTLSLKSFFILFNNSLSERNVLISDLGNINTNFSSILYAPTNVNLSTTLFFSAIRVNFIDASMSPTDRWPVFNLDSHFEHKLPVLASKEQIGVFNISL
jgi:hypothetical protein